MYLFKLWFSWDYIPKSGIEGSHGSSIFSFLRNLPTVLHSGCSNLYSHQQHRRLPFFSTTFPAIVIYRLFMLVSLTSVRWYLIVVFICISLVISDAEHLFMCLLAICRSSLEKCLLRSSVHFSTRLVFWLLSCMSCLYILEINPLLFASFANIFSHSVSCLFIFMVSFPVQSL